MAKETVKPVKKAAAKPAAKAKPSVDLIEKVSQESLQKLQELGIEQQLQSDIEWCLGSYRHDKNPTGLYEMAEKTLVVFQAEKTKKTKGITAKLITDLESALKTASA